MANTNSNLAASAAAIVNDPSQAVLGRDLGAIVLYARGSVTVPATPSTSDTLTLLAANQLPLDAVVIPELCHFFTETNPGTALGLDVGTATDVDRYADNLSLTDALTKYGFEESGTLPVGISAPAAVTTQEAVIATVVTSTSVSETVVDFAIAYRVTA
jgi:hypothetical protein